jgi:acyl-CoA oxidase
MPDFTDNLKPASPDGPSILKQERASSDVPVDELTQHLLSRNGFVRRQERILQVLEADRLFKKVKQMNLSRPERYQLGLARAKKLCRYADKYGWDEKDLDMAIYLCDDVSPYMVHFHMFGTTIREQGNEEQRAYWLPKFDKMEIVGCYAQ